MQKLPIKKKTNKKTFSTAEVNAKEKYYKDLEEFYELNNRENRSETDLKYNAEFDSTLKRFVIDKFDHSKFETFGVIIDKKLYLAQEEAVYLNQIGLIKFASEQNVRDLVIANFVLYGYLRRAGKIVTCAVNFSTELSLDQHSHDNERDKSNSKFNDYYIVFNTTEDFKQKVPDMLLRCFPQDKFSFDIIETTLKDSKSIKESNFSPEIDIKTCIALVKESSIHILSINDIDLLNI